MALDTGCQAISLGENRLRTETAALVACMGVNFLNDEM
jgi:16S rRNA (uracil1498-N3)-methyltransferase